MPWKLKRSIEEQREATLSLTEQLRDRIDGADGRLAAVESRLDAIEEVIRGLQGELAELREDRVARLEHRFDELADAGSELGATAARLRDRVIPAVVERGNLLVDRLSEQLEEVASLVERALRREPLPVPPPSETEHRLATALAEVQPLLVESFRGSEEEVRHRLDRHLETLRGSAPVLDLGCGRGELLDMLREAGIEARGVELDPALAQAARRRGLEVAESEVLEHLEKQPPDSLGAVTAIHLVEHLEAAEVLALLAEIRRVLRRGGLLLIECPNPHNLRVGAALYWLDPTHRRPLMPETLELFCVASGLEIRGIEPLHPFPEEQSFSDPDEARTADATPEVRELADRLDRVTDRLDELLNGPRDFALVAAKPTES
jgi:O-antigen chain-terminating methyltransferase